MDIDKLSPVFLPELCFPCWAYALRRIGCGELLTPEWVYNIMPGHIQPLDRFPECGNEIGNILVWKTNEDDTVRTRDYYPVELTENGIVKWRFLAYDYHAAVYEGNGVVSDYASTTDNLLPFEVRFRNLSEIREPDGIIFWWCLKN